VAGTCEYGDEPSGSKNAGNFLTSSKPDSFSRRTLLHGVSKYEGKCVCVCVCVYVCMCARALFNGSVNC